MINLWGMFYCFCVPSGIISICCYLEGIEEGKKIKNKKRRIK